jgi:hypothetical protein
MFGINIKTPKKLHQDKVIDRWSNIIIDANGRGEEILKSVVEKIEAAEIPNIKISKKEVTPKKWGMGIFSKKNRVFLLVENEYFPGYEMFIGARDYGKQLSVSWYLTGETAALSKLANLMPSSSNAAGSAIMGSLIASLYLFKYAFDKIDKKMRGGKPTASMDIFDVEELSAFVTISHRALLDSIEELMTGLNQDFSKVERKSRGFLNIS